MRYVVPWNEAVCRVGWLSIGYWVCIELRQEGFRWEGGFSMSCYDLEQLMKAVGP